MPYLHSVFIYFFKFLLLLDNNGSAYSWPVWAGHCWYRMHILFEPQAELQRTFGALSFLGVHCISLRMHSSSMSKVEEISAEIQKRAITTCAIHNTTMERFYEIAFTRYFASIAVCGDELPIQVAQNLLDYFGREADILAVNVVANKLSLDDVLPRTQDKIEDTNMDNQPSWLIYDKAGMAKGWSKECLDDDLDFSASSFSKSERGRWEDMSEDCAKRSVSASDHIMTDDEPKMRFPVASKDSKLPATWLFRESWLKDVCSILSTFDGAILRQNIPSLCDKSLQKVVSVSKSERIIYLAQRSTLQGKEQSISKMAMRKILEETFAKLACAHADIEELQTKWHVTKDRKQRKGKGSMKQHKEQWLQRTEKRCYYP